ncbi:hypothetical protein BN1708_006590, partial [Verticillium longisporum]
MSSAEDSTP